MLITSTENNKIKNIKKLYNKKNRDEKELFLIEGEHLVLEAYKRNCLVELYVLENTNINIDFPIIYVTNNILKYISNLDSIPNMIGVCKKINNSVIGNKVLMLDNIQDPGNLGTIIRSSVAFNINTIILSKSSVDVYNHKVLRATQGMLFSINIIYADLIETINLLSSKDYKIYGTKVNGGKSIKNVEKNKKFVIIVGNEGNGVAQELLNLCNEYIYIDMNESCESLNVGVATSIILYELNK